jgi:DNA polymerase-4
MFQILEDFTPLIQPISIDEAFLDLTGTDRLQGEPVGVARRIKQRVRDELGLTISIGVAPNKFLAKLASDLQKPDGLTVIRAQDIDRILLPLPISRIWGIGPRTQKRLNELGLHTIGDVRKWPLKLLTDRFGPEGERYYRLSRGLDDRPVHSDSQAKSIGHEQTFGVNLSDPEELRAVLLGHVEQVGRRLRRHRLRARGVTLKIRDGEFHTITRGAMLREPTDLTQTLWEAARQIFDDWAQQSFKPLRLLGMQATPLTADAEQLSLFADPQAQRLKRVDAAVDQIHERFGSAAVHRGIGKRRRREE